MKRTSHRSAVDRANPDLYTVFMFGISGEHLLVLGIVLLIFGPRRLPELGNTLGKAIRNFKDSLSGVEEASYRRLPNQDANGPSLSSALASAPAPASTQTAAPAPQPEPQLQPQPAAAPNPPTAPLA